MTQVNRGIGKIEVGLIICVSLVGVLSVSSFFLFLRAGRRSFKFGITIGVSAVDC